MNSRKEGLRHIKAFEQYVQMGKDRTLNQIAKQFDVKLNTAEKWSSNFQWKKRIQEMNENASLVSQKKLEEEYFGPGKERVQKMKLYLFAILDRMISKKQGELTVAELCKIFKIVKTELGEPCSIASATRQHEYKNPFEDLLITKFS